MTFGPDPVLRGARQRLSPILMTSLATGLALVPLVVLGLRPGITGSPSGTALYDARSTAFRRAGSHRRTAKPPSE